MGLLGEDSAKMLEATFSLAILASQNCGDEQIDKFR